MLDIYDTLVIEPTPRDDIYDLAVNALKAYFLPTVNVPNKRHDFRALNQKVDEMIKQFVVRLKQQAVMYNFSASESEMIRYQIIEKCKSSALRSLYIMYKK